MEKVPVCRPITTTKCDDVTYTKCEEVPDQVCSSVEIPVPAQQQLHKQEISYFIEKSAILGNKIRIYIYIYKYISLYWKRGSNSLAKQKISYI